MKKRKNQLIKKTGAIATLIILLSTTIASATPISKDTVKNEYTAPSLTGYASKAFILTTNYYQSSFSVIDTSNPESVKKDIASTHGDDEVRYYDGNVYVLNRYGYNYIEVFDTENNFEKVSEFSTGNGTNPHDIAFVSDSKAYVTCYDSPYLLIINPKTGRQLGTIDLSEYADSDGIPEMDKMISFKFLGKDRIYVTIQRLDRDNWFAPTDKSYVLEIDADADKVIKAIQLTGENPSTELIRNGAFILVGEAGSWSDLDGGIECINILTNKAEGFIITESKLGGNIIDFDISNKYSGLTGFILSLIEDKMGLTLLKQNAYAVVSDMTYNTSLVSFNSKDQTSSKIFSTEGYQLADLAIINSEKLYLADRTPDTPGIRIFNTKTGAEETNAPINVGSLPPVHITFI